MLEAQPTRQAEGRYTAHLARAHLHHRDVSVKHSKCQRSPMPAVGVNGGVPGIIAWNLEQLIPQMISVSWMSDIPGQVTQASELRGFPAGMVTRSQLRCFPHLIDNVCLEHQVDKAQRDVQLVMSALGRMAARGHVMPQREAELGALEMGGMARD